MERASEAFVEKFLELENLEKQILIFTGTGNNGGDGLAIARMLKGHSKNVKVYLVGNSEKGSPDFLSNLERLGSINAIPLRKVEDVPNLSADQVIIDALFGSGLSRPIEGFIAKVIARINASGALVYSVDIASGLYADGMPNGPVIEPDHTISFQLPKLSFFQPELHRHVGEWHVVNISLDQDFIASCETEHHLLAAEDVSSLLPKRRKFDHKGSAGRLLLIAGSEGKMGAAILAARAAFRSGVGLLKIHLPACGRDILQSMVPEAMTISDSNESHISSSIDSSEFNAMAIGPGFGTQDETLQALSNYLESGIPLVLDADALNTIAKQDWISKIPPESILTPHPGEFKRLVGAWPDDFDKLEKLKNLCVKHQLNVVLKGAHSAICDSAGQAYYNSTGNPGMATAGSGDVLTGIIGALLSQGLNPCHALRLGVYLHGHAGDLAEKKVGQISLNASDIIDHIPSAILALQET